jgi:hypothetical protein
MATTESARADLSGKRTSTLEPATPTEDLVTVVLGTCLMLGALTDGWAHSNLLSELQQEGFFTPWHGLLYSAFTALAAWIFWLAYRRRDRHPRWWVDGWPAGYKLGAIGVLTFMIAGLADMVWHMTFGVETGVDAVLSPSHLLLCLGTVLMVTSALRSWWATGENGRRAATGVAGLALATVSVSVFLLYVSAFDSIAPTQPYEPLDGTIGQLVGTHGVSSYLVTTLVLVLPLLLAHRRRYTPGVATALVFAVSMFPMGTSEFPRPLSTAAFAAIAAAAVVDWILGRLDHIRGFDAPLRLPIAGVVFAVVVWTVHLVALHLDAGVTWPAELIGGTIAVTSGAAALLGGLASRPHDYTKVAA